jgi:uncharacterized repeat protein (TIGR01451 family)
MKKQLLLLTLCFVTVFVSLSAVSAANLYVNTTGDDTTGDGSATLPFLTIAKGVTTAVSGDTVIIAPGTYTGAGNKNIDINKDITIQGAGENQTIIDLEGSGYAFEFASPSTATVKNLTIKNGSTSDYGGAIRNFGATLSIQDCSFQDNAAGREGGAIYNTGTLTITGSSFTDNKLMGGGHGGAIYNPYGGILTINNCNFNNNQGTWGAVANYDGTCTIKNSDFQGNIGINYGGALWNVGTMTVTGCNFIGNTANLYGGGAIFQVGYGTLTANFNRFYNNNAPSGDAIYCMAGSVLAENNWWGSNTDPSTVSGLIYVESGSVDVNPWLILSIKADPTEIFNTQTSKVTADLFTDSSGADHSNDSAQYPSQIPLAFTASWGSISQAVLNFGTGTATFTANGGALPAQNPVTVSAADALNPTATVSTTITIKSAADLYVKVTSSNQDPEVDEAFTITYKLGNYGPDAAKNVTITLPLPAGFEVSKISGDGVWTYDAATNSITWTMTDVPVGDPYLYVTGKLTGLGSYVFGGSILSETFNLNTEGVTPVTVNVAEPEVKAATKTVAMQKTGVPLAYLVLAVLLMLGGLAVPKKK